MPDQHEIRESPIYSEVHAFYSALHAPGDNHVSDASDLVVAPDGRRAAFTGYVYPNLDAPPSTRIVTVDLGSGKLTAHPPPSASERLPRWAPDGKTLAFLSDRNTPGDFQVWLRSDDDLPVPAPRVPGVIESLEWSPDGKRLLLEVAGLGADLAGCQGGATVRQEPKSASEWHPKIDKGDSESLWRHAWLLTPGEQRAQRIGPDRLNVWETCWLGADSVAAIVSDSHAEWSWYTARAVSIRLSNGNVTELYRPTDQIGVPIANPSGDALALIEAVCSDRMIVCGSLRVIDPVTGAVRSVDTKGTDVTHFSWRDSNHLVYTGLRGLETVVGELAIRTSAAREIWTSFDRTCGGWYPNIAALPQGGAVVVGESWLVPPEIAVINGAGYRVVRSLATPTAQSPGFCHARAEPFHWSGRDGLEIQGVFIRPPGNGPWPLVMDIHGGPVWACRNRWHGRLRGAKVLADHGIASLYPNPRGSSGRGSAFARLVKGDMGGEDTHDYLRGIDALVQRGAVDPKRLGVTGISYGGFMSAWLVTQDSRFAAAVPISAVTDWYSQHHTSQIPYFDSLFLDGQPRSPDGLFFHRSPLFYVDRVSSPVLQLTGARDQNTPPTQALEFHRGLLEQGKRSVLVTYPSGAHGLRSFPEVIDATARYVSWFVERFSTS